MSIQKIKLSPSQTTINQNQNFKTTNLKQSFLNQVDKVSFKQSINSRTKLDNDVSLIYSNAIKSIKDKEDLTPVFKQAKKLASSKQEKNLMLKRVLTENNTNNYNLLQVAIKFENQDAVEKILKQSVKTGCLPNVLSNPNWFNNKPIDDAIYKGDTTSQKLIKEIGIKYIKKSSSKYNANEVLKAIQINLDKKEIDNLKTIIEKKEVSSIKVMV